MQYNIMRHVRFQRTFLKLALLSIVVGLLLTRWSTALPQARAATGPICDPFGSTTQGNYTIMNNRWGTSATQCINVTSNGFQITQQDGVGNTNGAPVSYPAIYVGCHYSSCSPNTNLPKQISTIGSANTSVNLTLTGSGTYDAAYDIWLNPTTNVSGVQASEIMIWLHWQGAIRPIGSQVGTVSLAGRTWEVWSGNNGQNNVVSYRSQNIASFNADVMPFIRDSFTRHASFGNTSWYLTSMQMGFEPWIGGVGLAVNSFSASISSGTTSSPTYYRLTARHSGKVADVQNPNTSDGAHVGQWGWNGANWQQWEFQPTDSGYYRIVSRHSGKCLDVYGGPGATGDGAQIVQWTCLNGTNQQWRMEGTDSGYVKLIARHSNKCLDVYGISMLDGAKLVQWTCLNGTNQQWLRQ